MNIGAEFAVVQMNCFNILKQIPTVGVIGISWWFYSEREMSMATLLLTSLFLNICIEHQLQIRWCREACLRDTSVVLLAPKLCPQKMVYSTVIPQQNPANCHGLAHLLAALRISILKLLPIFNV